MQVMYHSFKNYQIEEKRGKKSHFSLLKGDFHKQRHKANTCSVVAPIIFFTNNGEKM